MRIVTEKKEIYTFKELSEDSKQKAIEYFERTDFFYHILEERVSTLKELAKKISGTLDYSISLVADRGEFIKLENYDKRELDKLIENIYQCPITGCYYDIELLQAIKDGNIENYIYSIHEEYQANLEHDVIQELCEANEYEFLKDGKFY